MRYKLLLALLGLLTVFTLSASAANEFSLTLVSQTNSTVTFSYPQQAGYGYLYSANGSVISRTNDPTKTTVKFSKNYTDFEVAAIVKGPSGSCHFTNGSCGSVTPPGDTQAPTAPSNLRALSVSQTSIEIGWDASTDNVGVVNYQVYRNGTKIGEGPGSSGGFSNSWTDTGRTCNTSYNYTVNAQDAAGNTSAMSQILTVATSACSTPPPPPPACSDGLDNDGDGFVDYPADKGCTSATDTDETDSSGGGTETTITPSQFQSMVVSGATISDVHVTGDVSVNATNVKVQNCTIDGEIDFNPGASGSSLTNCSALGFGLFGADNITLDSNTFDGKGQKANNNIWDQPSGNQPDNFIIRNNSFSNYYIGQCCDVHSEALYVGYSSHGLIENNTFNNNGTTSHIFFTWFGNLASPPASNPHDMCVRGNTFGPTAGAYYDINIRQEIDPVASNIKVDPTSNVMPDGVTDNRLLAAC